ncbi:MAG: hypothetical protein PUC05_00705 [Firmicutes bacterium]|nr:hypothetical protein [Bacillota bacterium]
MKKIIVSLIMMLLVFSMVACAPSNTTQEDIIKRVSEQPYERLITVRIGNLNDYYYRTLGITIFKLILEHTEENPWSLSYVKGDINITELEKVSKIQCLRNISDNRVYSIHRSAQDVLYYAFYSYSNDSWISDREVYCASKGLSKSDFADIKTGDSLTDVMNIDPSQKESAESLKEVKFEKYLTWHLTKDGLLKIEYESAEERDKLDPDTMIITGMEWSELPILEQDLPK